MNTDGVNNTFYITKYVLMLEDMLALKMSYLIDSGATEAEKDYWKIMLLSKWILDYCQASLSKVRVHLKTEVIKCEESKVSKCNQVGDN